MSTPYPMDLDNVTSTSRGFVTKDSGKRQKWSTGAQRDTEDGKGRYDLLPAGPIHRVAQLYQRGAVKYDDWNWTKGIPSSRFLSSLLRHAFQYLRGDRSEDHLAAVVFNAFGLMFNEDTRPDQNDLIVWDGALKHITARDAIVGVEATAQTPTKESV